MSGFEAAFGTDEASATTVRLRVCATCGAVVIDRHTSWHNRLTAELVLDHPDSQQP